MIKHDIIEVSETKFSLKAESKIEVSRTKSSLYIKVAVERIFRQPHSSTCKL